jgi:hypothetical protein
MSAEELYYLNSILRQLREFKTSVSTIIPLPSLGMEVLQDNIDWLDCFIDMHRKKLDERR